MGTKKLIAKLAVIGMILGLAGCAADNSYQRTVDSGGRAYVPTPVISNPRIAVGYVVCRGNIPGELYISVDNCATTRSSTPMQDVTAQHRAESKFFVNLIATQKPKETKTWPSIVDARFKNTLYVASEYWDKKKKSTCRNFKAVIVSPTLQSLYFTGSACAKPDGAWELTKPISDL